ncbi:cardiolipin synthase [Nonlabens sp.]|uniref:cardiolipin synthase n=1 Tax=Nonlabens sp. TaxID=1888209 RepID=UPI003F69B827
MLDWILNNWFLSLLIANYIVAISAAFFLIRSNQNPRKTVSSLLFLVALPFLGLGIYYFFGLDYRKSKIFKRKDLNANELIHNWNKRLHISDDDLDKYEETFLIDRLKMVKLLRHNQAAPLTLSNNLQVLINGRAKFNQLFKDIKKAKHHIHLEYFIICDDHIGNEVIDALIKASHRGVEVKMIYDSVGSDISRAARNKMTAAGIEHAAFMPVLFSKFTRKANYRNHRKIFIIDGSIGYIGGVNISDDYVNEPINYNGNYWRDTHLRIEGHAVKSLQAQWLLNWFFIKEQEDQYHIHKDYFPEITLPENKAVQIAASGPDTDWANIMEALFIAINTAEETVYITTPYFIPNEAILTSLKSAARSGVEIHIMVPKKGDSWAARYASRSYFEDLLESGIHVHWYHRGMLHAKTMVVDGLFATIGTSNMDYRSFDINFEINALIYDHEIAEQLNNQFLIDLEYCEEVHLDLWIKRDKMNKFKESFCRLWAPLL